MKKVSLLTTVLAAGLALSAQETTPKTTTSPPIGSPYPVNETQQLRTQMGKETRFGLLGGINLAKFSAKEFTASAEPKTTSKTSFHAGAFVNIPLSPTLRLQPELVFSSQGSKIEETTYSTAGSRTFNYEFDLHYANLPVMLQLQTPGGFFVETGPQFSYLIDAKSKGITPISTEEETDYDFYFDNFDIAWGVGAGYLSPIGLGVHARYNYGIRNIVNESDVDLGELRNRVFQVGLIYQFGSYQ